MPSLQKTAVRKSPKSSWRSLPLGGVITQAGNSREYKTGDWVTSVAKWNPETCIHCLRCWAVCPDACIIAKDGKMEGINEEFCKACGFCVWTCPTNPKSLSLEKKQAREI
jgi:pyruvate ferredoxin oxidoreductase delta subunit